MRRNFWHRIPVGVYLGMPLAIFAAALQSTVVSRMRIWGVSVDLVLLLTVSWTLLQGVGEGLLISLVGGVLLDALSGAPFGLMTISLTAASELAGLGEANVFERARYLPHIAIVLATTTYRGLLLILLRMTGRALPPWSMLSRFLLLAIVMNGFAMFIVYGLIGILCSCIQPRRAEWE